MGYAGYSKGNYVDNDLSDLDKALRAIRNCTSLETIHKFTRNVQGNATDEKFRKIRLTNEKVATLLTNVPGAVDVMVMMGWQLNGEFLELPASKQMTMTDVHAVFNALEWRKKEADKDARAAAAKKKPVDPAKAALLAQMDADRKERAAKDPVTKASVNQWKGNENGGNITRAADVGIGCDKGG